MNDPVQGVDPSGKILAFITCFSLWNATVGLVDEWLEDLGLPVPPSAPVGPISIGFIVAGENSIRSGVQNAAEGVIQVIGRNRAGIPKVVGGVAEASWGSVLVGAGVLDIAEHVKKEDYRSPLHALFDCIRDAIL